jgi:ATP-dependent Clp protease ATP-binding subunit ClpC
MFERFTEPARQVIVLSQDEARTLAHDYIGTEHILLGLLREEKGLAGSVLESLEISYEGVRAQVEHMVGKGDAISPSQIPFTPRAKKTLDLALREALALGHNYVGTEHILLGLGEEREGVAFRILRHFGADAETIRNRTIVMLSEPGERGEPVGPAARPQAELRVPNWEYRLERTPNVDALSVDSLNELGSDGWELAGVVPNGGEVVLLFKRRRS